MVGADLRADASDGLLHVVAHDPVGARAADLAHETVQDVRAALRVGHFRVKLEPVEPARGVGHARDGARAGRGDRGEAGGQRGDLVAMAHPDLHPGGPIAQVAQQRRAGRGLDIGMAELARRPGLDAAAELVRHQLHAVADAEHGQAELEERGIARGGARFVDAGRAAGEDEALRRARRELRRGQVAAQDLTVHVQLADTPRDQLRVLRSEVEDCDPIVRHLARRMYRGNPRSARVDSPPRDGPRRTRGEGPENQGNHYIDAPGG